MSSVSTPSTSTKYIDSSDEVAEECRNRPHVIVRILRVGLVILFVTPGSFAGIAAAGSFLASKLGNGAEAEKKNEDIKKENDNTQHATEKVQANQIIKIPTENGYIEFAILEDNQAVALQEGVSIRH